MAERLFNQTEYEWILEPNQTPGSDKAAAG